MTAASPVFKAKLSELGRRTNLSGLVQLSGHAGAALGTGWLVVTLAQTYWLLPAIVLHGVVLVFLFSAEHEAIHFTAFHTRALNWAVAWLAGLILMLPPAWFRCFHLAHHRWTQDLARDPELATPKPSSLQDYLWWISGMPYWRDRVTVTIRHVFGTVEDVFVPVRSRRSIVREARICWVAYGGFGALTVVTSAWQEILMLWIIPVIVGQPFLRLFLLAEHTGCPNVSDMFANSRTTRTNALFRFLTWNMPYHVEHHAYPGIPFRALPKLHEELASRITHLAPGYITVHTRLVRDVIGHH